MEPLAVRHTRQVLVAQDPEHLATQLRELARGAGDHHGDRPLAIALSGGSVPALLASALQHAAPSPAGQGALQLDRWHIFFADERIVPLDHADSNYGLCKRVLLDVLPALRPEQVYAMDDAPLREGRPAEEVHEELAASYDQRVREVFRRVGLPMTAEGMPVFDLVFLGMGPDGHTCSLFPGHPLALPPVADAPGAADKKQEQQAYIRSLADSPKPPPCRITFTLPLLHAARHAVYVVTGAAKAPVLEEILVRGSLHYPAGLVRSQCVTWLLDAAAAGSVPPTPAQ